MHSQALSRRHSGLADHVSAPMPKVHIWSVKPEFEEKFADRLEREKAEQDRLPPRLPGNKLSISFQPSGAKGEPRSGGDS